MKRIGLLLFTIVLFLISSTSYCYTVYYVDRLEKGKIDNAYYSVDAMGKSYDYTHYGVAGMYYYIFSGDTVSVDVTYRNFDSKRTDDNLYNRYLDDTKYTKLVTYDYYGKFGDYDAHIIKVDYKDKEENKVTETMYSIYTDHFNYLISSIHWSNKKPISDEFKTFEKSFYIKDTISNNESDFYKSDYNEETKDIDNVLYSVNVSGFGKKDNTHNCIGTYENENGSIEVSVTTVCDAIKRNYSYNIYYEIEAREITERLRSYFREKLGVDPGEVKERKIIKIGKYWSYYFHMNVTERDYYYWRYVIKTDNTDYTIDIFGRDRDYINSPEVLNFFNTFTIKDSISYTYKLDSGVIQEFKGGALSYEDSKEYDLTEYEFGDKERELIDRTIFEYNEPVPFKGIKTNIFVVLSVFSVVIIIFTLKILNNKRKEIKNNNSIKNYLKDNYDFDINKDK